jgi:hypothetical protein
MNYTTTLKVLVAMQLVSSNHELYHCTIMNYTTTLKVLVAMQLVSSNHELCHCTGDVTQR